ncbi:MAG: aminotransferase class III [Gammaproteobacteria bacterium]|nr:aminotransferase class III [Gammaproteobacteria bacterium]|tara:strand:+ start:16192 stop:17499 length:1308 start_codon:yes stop_codon:yes gene_type:complete
MNKINLQKLLSNAKKIIPGGNQLISKRSEMFLPGLWPNFYKKAKGCSIWDLNNNHYYDFCGMGVTSCVLGYSDNEINQQIVKAIKNGSMSTLNSYEEYELAKKLINIHPWSSMVKFTRSGGEACSVAIRIARAYSGKDKIAICGYHGWHDWYLSLNLKNKNNLDKQLLPGLKTIGVPKSLSKTTVPFSFNDKKSFDKIINKKIGVIIMEPMRDKLPDLDFLRHVRSTAKKINAVLIFDEITSGFHDNYGGIHLKFGINPDIVIFGKALGNGHPISAIVGKKNIMNRSQDTFISSTMWTERVGFVAGIATLNKMKKINVQIKNINKGNYLRMKLYKVAKKYNINISICGLESIPILKFLHKDSDRLMTYYTQEMLKVGYLAGSQIVMSSSHTQSIINQYIKAADEVFKSISKYISSNKKVPLKGAVKHNTFKRLTT